MIQTTRKAGRATSGGARHASRLLACCILDGGVRASPLVQKAGRSVLDLDVAPDRRLLDVWIDALSAIEWDTQTPLCRVLHGPGVAGPTPRPTGLLSLEIRGDSGALRGPAGVVRDAMGDLPEDGAFLVCESGRYIAAGLGDLVDRHRREQARVTIARDASGAPAGVLVVDRMTLDAVADRGFVDLKEQWLGRLLRRGDRVVVHDLPPGSALPVRSRLDLLRVARVESGAPEDVSGPDPWRARARLARRLTPGWSVSRGALIGGGSVVARSIVMERAVIGDDAVVSSSLVLPGAVVAPGSVVVDRVVS